MSFEKQVDKRHYDFFAYIDKERWASFWHQIDEVLSYFPDSVLEVGGGPGILKSILTIKEVRVTSVDIAEDLNPDVVASVTDLPFNDESFDVSCAFEVLEHIEFRFFVKSLSELSRVARVAVVISIPDARFFYPQILSIPYVGKKCFLLPRPFKKLRTLKDEKEHKWEINRGVSLRTIEAAIRDAGLFQAKTFRVDEHPYHRFFVLEKRND